MTTEFSNEDVQRVMSKLLSRIQESDKAFSLSLPTSDSLSKLPNTEETLTTEDSPLKSKTIKPKEFIDITLARMNEKKLKSQENLKKIAESQAEKEKALYRKKPEINKNSAKLGKRDNPVHERVEKEVDESKKALKRVKEKLEKERNDKIKDDLTFKPKLHKPNKNPRTKEEYLMRSEEWMNKRKLKLDKKTEEVQGKFTQELKFAPSLDPNSVNIVDALGSRKPIADRLHEKHELTNRKIQAMREEQIHSFAPTIEENSRMMAKHQIEGPVHERLFGLSNKGGLPARTQKTEVKLNRSFSFSNDFEDDPQRKLDFLFDLN